MPFPRYQGFSPGGPRGRQRYQPRQQPSCNPYYLPQQSQGFYYQQQQAQVFHPRSYHGSNRPRPYHAAQPYQPFPDVEFQPRGRKPEKKCPECGKVVLNLSEHRRKNHQLKDFGYFCDICGHFEGQDDKHLMVSHFKFVHPFQAVQWSGKQLEKSYQYPERCSVQGCFYKTPSLLALGLHALKSHANEPEVESYSTNTQSFLPSILEEQDIWEHDDSAPPPAVAARPAVCATSPPVVAVRPAVDTTSPPVHRPPRSTVWSAMVPGSRPRVHKPAARSAPGLVATAGGHSIIRPVPVMGYAAPPVSIITPAASAVGPAVAVPLSHLHFRSDQCSQQFRLRLLCQRLFFTKRFNFHWHFSLELCWSRCRARWQKHLRSRMSRCPHQPVPRPLVVLGPRSGPAGRRRQLLF